MPTGSAPVDDARQYARLKQRHDLAFDAIAVRGRHVLRACVDAVFHDRLADVALVREAGRLMVTKGVPTPPPFTSMIIVNLSEIFELIRLSSAGDARP